MAADPEIPDPAQVRNSLEHSPSRSSREKSPMDNYEPEEYDPEEYEKALGFTADASNTAADVLMQDEEEEVQLSADVMRDAECAQDWSSRYDRPAIKYLDPDRLPSIIKDERKVYKSESADDEEDEKRWWTLSGGGRYELLGRRAKTATSIRQFTSDADDAGRNMPAVYSEFYDVGKHGPLDESVTDVSNMPVKILLATLNDPTKSAEERIGSTDRMLRNISSMQEHGTFARKYLSKDELRSLEDGGKAPTSSVVAAMGVQVEDLNQPTDYQQMKRQSVAVAPHDCGTCQAKDTMERDRLYHELADRGEKRLQGLRHGYQFTVNQAVAGTSLPTVYISTTHRKQKTVYLPPPVPGIDALIQIHLPRTQPVVPTLQSLGLAPGQIGSPFSAPAAKPSSSPTQAPSPLPGTSKQLSGVPTSSPAAGPEPTSLFNFTPNSTYGVRSDMGGTSTFDKPSNAGKGTSPISSTLMFGELGWPNPYVSTGDATNMPGLNATSTTASAKPTAKPGETYKADPGACAPTTTNTATGSQASFTIIPHAPATAFGNLGLKSEARSGGETGQGGGKRMSRKYKLDVMNEDVLNEMDHDEHAKKKQRLSGTPPL
ncbi:hypothetical protein LTR85_002510 [Meristemomyces frigidus]|nr:hypothetical protein LTR85_002510 [Meristemomyces frigidus]